CVNLPSRYPQARGAGCTALHERLEVIGVTLKDAVQDDLRLYGSTSQRVLCVDIHLLMNQLQEAGHDIRVALYGEIHLPSRSHPPIVHTERQCVVNMCPFWIRAEPQVSRILMERSP